jgi:nucleolar pre-ribosomal-associated protein 2
MASSHAPRLPPNFAGFVYARLCALVSALLTVHRIRLRGRYHIVLAVLQGLLRCLFVSHATKGSSTESAVPAAEALRPPWLGSGTFVPAAAAAAAAAAHDKSSSLGPGQATAYASLLTALCDPTVSSVAGGGGGGGARQHKLSKPDLTPATDRARRQAGQYLPYLLTEYAQWQLHSRLLPDVRAALLPGLYAIFAAAGPEMLRKVNASMDAASQEIFKTLYHDYQRFGR